MNKHVLYGLTATVAMFVFYFGVLSLANSPRHALEQLALFWYLILPLVILIGIQVGLYTHIKCSISEKDFSAAKGGVAASGGMSGGAMVACCVHHVADIFPLLGLTAAAVFLSQYQGAFMVLGIASGVIGVLYMLEAMKKNNVAFGPAAFLAGLGLTVLRKGAIIAGVIVVVLVFFYTYTGIQDGDKQIAQAGAAKKAPEAFSANANPGGDYLNRPLTRNGATMTASPSLDGNALAVFIALNVPHGNPIIDFPGVVTLEAEGRQYSPTEWIPFRQEMGSGAHIGDELKFGDVKTVPAKFSLKVKGVFGADWEFECSMDSKPPHC